MDMACAFGRPNGTNFGVLVGALLTWIVYLPAIGLPATLSIVRASINFGIFCANGLIFGIHRG